MKRHFRELLQAEMSIHASAAPAPCPGLFFFFSYKMYNKAKLEELMGEKKVHGALIINISSSFFLTLRICFSS